jgi:3-dehydro-L-gulonate 2-dehydrogenase
MPMQFSDRFSHKLMRSLANCVRAQVYLAIAASKLGDLDALERTVSAVIEDLHGVEPLVKGGSVSYPGEGMIKTRAENLAKGVPVDKQQWEELQRK